MAKRKKKPLLTRLKKNATLVFNKYIREKARVDYHNVCPLCGTNPIEVAFHVVSAKRKATCFDEHNVIGACSPCNYQENYYSDKSRAWYIRKFGVDQYLALVDRSAQDFDFTIEYLADIILDYQEKLKQTPRKPS